MANARQAVGEVRGVRWKCIWWEKKERSWDDYFALDIGMSDVRLGSEWPLRFLLIPRFFYYSVQFSHSVTSDSLHPHGLQHARLPCPSPTPEACSYSCLSSHWCHPTISSSVVPFSSCLQSFPASGFFPMSQFFASGGQSIGVSASASIFYSLTIESAASSCAVVVIVIVQKSPGNTSVLGIPLWNGLKKNHKVDDISHLYSSPLVISSSIPPSYP